MAKLELSAKVFLILLINVSCTNKLIDCVSDEKNLHMVRGKTEDGSTLIVGNCYDAKTKNILNAAPNINGLALKAKDGHFEQYVWPGKYEIRVWTTGTKCQLKKIRIREGELITIEFFLKDDEDITIYNK